MLVDQQDSIRALRAVHGRFYLATLPLGVGIVGPGDIGKTFLAQIQDQAKVCMSCLLHTKTDRLAKLINHLDSNIICIKRLSTLPRLRYHKSLKFF